MLTSRARVVIFDADGVLVRPAMLFSHQYAAIKGLDPASFTPFFKGEFEEALCGRADLKDLIQKHNALWQHEGDAQKLLDQWFAAEHQLDDEAMDIVAQLRTAGVPIYLATNQEKYRAAYMRNEMFPNIFRKIFASADVGYTKKDVRFWQPVLQSIEQDVPDIQPGEIIFLDDSQDSVDGALAAGIDARLYTNISQIKNLIIIKLNDRSQPVPVSIKH